MDSSCSDHPLFVQLRAWCQHRVGGRPGPLGNTLVGRRASKLAGRGARIHQTPRRRQQSARHHLPEHGPPRKAGHGALRGTSDLGLDVSQTGTEDIRSEHVRHVSEGGNWVPADPATEEAGQGDAIGGHSERCVSCWDGSETFCKKCGEGAGRWGLDRRREFRGVAGHGRSCSPIRKD